MPVLSTTCQHFEKKNIIFISMGNFFGFCAHYVKLDYIRIHYENFSEIINLFHDIFSRYFLKLSLRNFNKSFKFISQYFCFCWIPCYILFFNGCISFFICFGFIRIQDKPISILLKHHSWLCLWCHSLMIYYYKRKFFIWKFCDTGEGRSENLIF